jgi:hypothetical protein
MRSIFNILSLTLAGRQSARPLFCFWEPADSLPPYLHLCMRTWALLQDVELHLLDYRSVGRFTGRRINDAFRRYPLAQQADAIRFELLALHGGVWMDADALVHRDPTEVWTALSAHDIILFGVPGASANLNFLAANRSRLPFFEEVAEQCWKLASVGPPAGLRWDYVGMPFRQRIPGALFSGSTVQMFDEDKSGYLMEASLGPTQDKAGRYAAYWLKAESFEPSALASQCGVIALHNSWMPDSYRQRTSAQVLSGPERVSQAIRYCQTLL